MILNFILTMPNNNSWNGHWSGEDDFYAKTINLGRTKRAEAKAQEILDKGNFYYNFGDGWGANVSVKKIDSKEAGQVRKKSKGFCGYEWMIESILEKQKIVA